MCVFAFVPTKLNEDTWKIQIAFNLICIEVANVPNRICAILVQVIIEPTTVIIIFADTFKFHLDVPNDDNVNRFRTLLDSCKHT